ncbi:MAG: hypothetical protein EZS28_046234 [Streblomastix strix]|uniref:Uncharacterized protein n=1 Tax=Streblomastix strix TaxID=222440 RepID=A0A5J4TJJ9_9EUKA|nr:MAG: hypothetical protein EZS28_046234 [Streblomastix strix]
MDNKIEIFQFLNLTSHFEYRVIQVKIFADEQLADRVRRQLIIDSITDADRQQGANGENLKSNTGAGNKSTEPNIHRAQTEWRMAKIYDCITLNSELLANHFQDDRHPRYDLDAEERRLYVHVGYNICIRPHQGQLTTAIISRVQDTRNQLHVSKNAI